MFKMRCLYSMLFFTKKYFDRIYRIIRIQRIEITQNKQHTIHLHFSFAIIFAVISDFIIQISDFFSLLPIFKKLFRRPRGDNPP
jgi:hypothetical protein